MGQLEVAYHDERKSDRSRRKTCTLSIRITQDELTWLAERAQAEGCMSVSEYTRNALFRSTKLPAQSKDYELQIAHLKKDVQDLRQDLGKIWSSIRG